MVGSLHISEADLSLWNWPLLPQGQGELSWLILQAGTAPGPEAGSQERAAVLSVRSACCEGLRS